MKKTIFLTLLITVPYLSGCDSDDNDTTVNIAANTISWSDCGEAGLQCGSLSVPVDYTDTEAAANDIGSIDLALIRHAATGSRKGSLLLNPGGPGGSGVVLLQEFIAYEAFPETILASYDVIGFDPRGVGDSRPVDCDEFGLDDIDSYPVDETAVTNMHSSMESFAARCFEKYGSYLQHLGSANVARDMDEIRQALGDEKLNFIGYSYGTRLGALYLQMFPENSGQIVLDASLPPQSDIAFLTEGQLNQMQINIERILGSCLEDNQDCDPDNVYRQLNQRILDLVSANTPEAGEVLELAGDIIIEATLNLEFAELAAESIIDYASTGEISSFASLLSLLESLEDSEQQDNSELDDEDIATAEVAIMCADDAVRPDATDLVDAVADFNNRSDLFAEYVIPQLGLCSGWPEAIEPLAPIVVSTAPQSLIIGGTNDAQTPLQWSELMASSIGGIFITSEHSGHTAAFNDSSACVSDIAEAFLIDNTIPDAVFCAQE